MVRMSDRQFCVDIYKQKDSTFISIYALNHEQNSNHLPIISSSLMVMHAVTFIAMGSNIPLEP